MSFFTKRFGKATSPVRSEDLGSGSDVVKEKDSVAVKATGAELTPADELETAAQLKAIKKKHEWDPNFSEELVDDIEEATQQHDVGGEVRLINEVIENSPYPEVRAAVRNVSSPSTGGFAHADNGSQYDEDVPVDTVRAWVLGMLLTTIASGLNALFALRQPAITINSLTVQLVAYPLGVAWYHAMPKRQFRLFGKSFTLNNGPFNMKEHTIIVVMANVNVAGETFLLRLSATLMSYRRCGVCH